MTLDFAPPSYYTDTPDPGKLLPEYHWILDLPSDTYFALWLRSGEDPPLPIGYNLYVLSWHEPIDYNWLRKQADKVESPIIALFNGKSYDADAFPNNVHFFTFYEWHLHCKIIKNTFTGNITCNDKKFKASAICNRITQSKLIITTAILEILGDTALVKLGDWIEEKNVNWRQPTNIDVLDKLQDIFYSKYAGNVIQPDKFGPKNVPYQKLNSNPFLQYFSDSVLHFCLESYHYSYMVEDNKSFTLPGPDCSEKTWKTLLGKSAFIPVGQFDILGHLSTLGFTFDYKGLDLNYDKDSGNLTRLVKQVKLVEQIADIDINELKQLTTYSVDHNYDHIISGQFGDICNKINLQSIDQIFNRFT